MVLSNVRMCACLYICVSLCLCVCVHMCVYVFVNLCARVQSLVHVCVCCYSNWQASMGYCYRWYMSCCYSYVTGWLLWVGCRGDLGWADHHRNNTECLVIEQWCVCVYVYVNIVCFNKVDHVCCVAIVIDRLIVMRWLSWRHGLMTLMQYNTKQYNCIW